MTIYFPCSTSCPVALWKGLFKLTQTWIKHQNFHDFTNLTPLDTAHSNKQYSDPSFSLCDLVSQTAQLSITLPRLSRRDYLRQAPLPVHQHSSCLQSAPLLLGCWFPCSRGAWLGVMLHVCGPKQRQKIYYHIIHDPLHTIPLKKEFPTLLWRRVTA